MFRQLTERETQVFVDWANDNYVPGEEISNLWHPAVRTRCHAINKAYAADPGLEYIAIEMRYV